MIDLAPRNKRGLPVRSPLLAGSGAVGFGDAWPPGVSPAMFGAVVSAGVSWQPQRGQAQPRLVEIPGGFLLATGDHNPGYRRVVQRYGDSWLRLGVPLVLALAPADPGDWARLTEHVEEEGLPVVGLELPLAPGVTGHEARAALGTVRHETELPLLVRLPHGRAVELAEAAVAAGADALVVGTPPTASFPAGADAEGAWITGPVAGPVALPFTLWALRRVAAAGTGAPLIAAGGIQSVEEVARCFELGATAVQIRSLMWTDPAAVVRLADALQQLAGLESD